MDDELKGVIWSRGKDYGKLRTKGLSWETRNLITEKDKDIPKEGRLTKCVLKIRTLARRGKNFTDSQHKVIQQANITSSSSPPN
jgi:hypothetical protein